MKNILLVSGIMILFSCASPEQKQASTDTTTVHPLPASLTKETRKYANFNWKDSLIESYIKTGKNEFIRLSVKQNIPVEWMFDQVQETDSAVYYVYQIGHSESDEGGMNKRFITDQWVYLDSARHLLYEYDLPNDRLSAWKQ